MPVTTKAYAGLDDPLPDAVGPSAGSASDPEQTYDRRPRSAGQLTMRLGQDAQVSAAPSAISNTTTQVMSQTVIILLRVPVVDFDSRYRQ